MPGPTYAWEERWDNRPASTDYKAGQKLQRAFWVTTDTPTISGGHAIAALAILAGVYKGTVHPSYPYAVCTNVSASIHPDDPFRWDVTAQYEEPAPQPGSPLSTPGGEGEPPEQGGGDPTDWAPKLKMSYRREEEWKHEDLTPEEADGPKKFVNAAGDPFENPPPHHESITVITMTNNYPAWNNYLGSLYYNKVNDEEWSGFPAGTAKIVGCEATAVTKKGYVYWEVSWTIEIDLDGWDPVKVLQIGWNYLASPGAVRTRVVDGYNQPSASPRLLKANGQLLGESERPVYAEFLMHEGISFDGI